MYIVHCTETNCGLGVLALPFPEHRDGRRVEGDAGRVERPRKVRAELPFHGEQGYSNDSNITDANFDYFK